MGKITDIKEQAKRTDRVSVYIDGKYRFSLTKDQAGKLQLKLGQDLSEGDIERLKDDSQFGKLRDNTFRWLSLRPRSEHEIEQYLRRKTENEDLRHQVMKLLRDMNYVDDESFARSWIQHRVLIKPMSKYRIKQELMQKRIPKDVIETSLEAAELDELAAVKEVIAKRRHRYRDQRKLMAYLARQGFSYDTIKQALEESETD